ncbi:MAG: DUF3108 domain-containing protein [Tannerellaceae bacterium]|jgi:hypothetical protein|nr:DUF3108 domain-containing protein [Tannerellaceae bacterium]
MREDGNHPEAIRCKAWAGRFSRYACLWAVCLLLFPAGTEAQCPPWENMFYHGERVDYDIFFKWGLIMPKAGLASFHVNKTTYRQNPAWQYRLLFRTVGVIDKIYRMRDTITTYLTPEYAVLFSSKRTNEDNYFLVDELTFMPDPTGKQSRVRSHRYTPTATKIDTLLVAEGCLYDLMAVGMYLRSIDWERLKTGDELPFQVAMGRDIIHASFRYTGQAVVKPNENLVYRARHFYIDIYDDAFTQSKEAAEIWVGDDDNHLPIRVRAKLKIGAAEVYFKEAQNLQYPLSCRIVIPPRK